MTTLGPRLPEGGGDASIPSDNPDRLSEATPIAATHTEAERLGHSPQEPNLTTVGQSAHVCERLPLVHLSLPGGFASSSMQASLELTGLGGDELARQPSFVGRGPTGTRSRPSDHVSRKIL